MTDPASDPQDFDFDLTGLGLPADLDLDTDAGDATLPSQQTFNLNAAQLGAHTVTESASAGWSLTILSCTGAGADSSIDLGDRKATLDIDAGETVVCTFTNTKHPTIVVRKITTGIAGGPFTFSTTGDNGFTTPFSLTTATAGVAVPRSFEIAAAGIGGDFSVTETALPAGFVLTDVGCVVTIAGAGGTVPGSNLATKTGTIDDLAAGATVTCTFTNSGVGTTRTQGFWSTHLSLVQAVWSPAGGTIGTIVHNGMTAAERTLCGHVLTVPEVMGGFWSNIAKTTTRREAHRSRPGSHEAAPAAAGGDPQQPAFGSSPSGGISIDQAKTAFCRATLDPSQSRTFAMAAFNESGDSGVFTPGASADPKAAKAIAELDFWDVLP